MNSTLGKMLLSTLIGAVLFFALFEGGLRMAFSRSMDFDIEMWKYATQVKQDAEIPGLGHEHRAGAKAHLMGVDVAINSRKLRDREIPFDRKPGDRRILMLGDSLTFGWGVRAEDTPSKLLEATLNGGTAHYDVINTGVGNYNTVQQVKYFLNEGRKYDPDLVVLNYFINDAEPTPHRNPVFLANHSYAYVFLKARIDMLRRQMDRTGNWEQYYRSLYLDGMPGWRAAEAAIRELASYCRDHGIKLLIANYPEIRVLKPYPFTPVNDWLSALAKALKVEYVDLLPAVEDADPSTLWVTPPDPHPNAKANRLFAGALEATVRRMNVWADGQ